MRVVLPHRALNAVFEMSRRAVGEATGRVHVVDAPPAGTCREGARETPLRHTRRWSHKALRLRGLVTRKEVAREGWPRERQLRLRVSRAMGAWSV